MDIRVDAFGYLQELAGEVEYWLKWLKALPRGDQNHYGSPETASATGCAMPHRDTAIFDSFFARKG